MEDVARAKRLRRVRGGGDGGSGCESQMCVVVSGVVTWCELWMRRRARVAVKEVAVEVMVAVMAAYVGEALA